jgi:hypothetical protein
MTNRYQKWENDMMRSLQNDMNQVKSKMDNSSITMINLGIIIGNLEKKLAGGDETKTVKVELSKEVEDKPMKKSVKKIYQKERKSR